MTPTHRYQAAVDAGLLTNSEATLLVAGRICKARLHSNETLEAAILAHVAMELDSDAPIPKAPELPEGWTACHNDMARGLDLGILDTDRCHVWHLYMGPNYGDYATSTIDQALRAMLYAAGYAVVKIGDGK